MDLTHFISDRSTRLKNSFHILPYLNYSGLLMCPFPDLTSVLKLLYLSSDHDELRYSFRSVLTHFRESAAQFRLLVSDVEAPGARVPQRSRLGQMPQWLSDPNVVPGSYAGMWQHGNIRLEIRHHSAFFQPGLLSGPTFNR